MSETQKGGASTRTGEGGGWTEGERRTDGPTDRPEKGECCYCCRVPLMASSGEGARSHGFCKHVSCVTHEQTDRHNDGPGSYEHEHAQCYAISSLAAGHTSVRGLPEQGGPKRSCQLNTNVCNHESKNDCSLYSAYKAASVLAFIPLSRNRGVGGGERVHARFCRGEEQTLLEASGGGSSRIKEG